MTTISTRQFATVKRTAMNVYPLVDQINKKRAEINKLYAEIEDLNHQVTSWEGGIIAMTGGYTSSDLVIKTVAIATNEDGSTKLDKNGKPVKITKWEASNNVVWNEGKKVYEITPHEDTNEAEEPANYDENYYGNDSVNSESQLPLNVLE